ncbi:FecR family protein [Chitinophaga lutea]
MDVNLLEKFIRGECTAEEAAKVREWLDSDPEALEQYLERTWKEPVEQPMPASMEKEILAMVLPARRQRMWWPAAAAAAVLLLVSGSWFFLNKQGAPNHMRQLTAGNTSTRFVLPDQSEVWLRAHTVLQYDSAAFGQRDRQVELLQGEAFFETVRDDRRAFIVKSGSVLTRVLGTSFSVDMHHNVTVTVATGKVAVSREGQALRALLPGEQLAIGAAGDTASRVVPLWTAGAWKAPFIQLTDASFTDLQLALEMLYGVRLSSLSEQVTRHIYNIRLDRSTPPEEVVQVLVMLNGRSYTKKDASSYIIH